MNQLQPSEFTHAVSALRQELIEELQERELEIRAERRLKQRDFGIWIVEKKRQSRDPVLADVLWASGAIATALQLALACSLASTFVRRPEATEDREPTPAPRTPPKGLTM